MPWKMKSQCNTFSQTQGKRSKIKPNFKIGISNQVPLAEPVLPSENIMTSESGEISNFKFSMKLLIKINSRIF